MEKEPLVVKISRLKRLSEQNKFQSEKQSETSHVGRLSADVNQFQKFFYQLSFAFVWIFNHILKPTVLWLCIPLKWLVFEYIKLWNFFVYKKDKYNIKIFVQTRAVLMVIVTFVFVCIFPFILQGFFDFGLYTLTAKTNEHLILFGSQEVNSALGDHNVEGCLDTKDYNLRGCADTETVYFRTRLSLFNEIWSLLYKHELYWPEYVGSAVPYTTSKCVADSYGIRFKFIMKDIEVYPTLLAVTCKPIERNN